ncbi:MAG: hypothetical protein R3F14_13510 [Polyangiaceae bacterium]
MTDTKSDVPAALVEVRKAYRLLHAYHQRISDLLRLIHGTLAERGLRFQKWSPVNVWLPSSRRAPFHHWAWDLTPAYQTSCVWEGTGGGWSRQIHVHMIADTGYDPSVGDDPSPEHFKPAEQSASEVRYGMYRTRARKADFGAAWKQISGLPDPTDQNEHKVMVGQDEYVYRHLARSLSDLPDREAVDRELLLPLRSWP